MTATHTAAHGSANEQRVASLLIELARLQVYEVHEHLGRADLYGPADTMLANLIEMDQARISQFVRALPDQPPSLNVLDLGANPYLVTRVLARLGANVTSGGLPAGDAPLPGKEWVEFVRPDGTVDLTVPLVRFNVDGVDPFPFDDQTFDVVVCGELIEHLPDGPVRLLHQCNRVLKLGGRLLLSTPNSNALSRIILMLKDENTDALFFDQDIYARHNRNYTMAELRDLMVGNGFRPLLAMGLLAPHLRHFYAPTALGTAKWATMAFFRLLFARSPGLSRRWGDALILAAEKVAPPSPYRPEWLYRVRGVHTIPMVAREGANSAGNVPGAGGAPGAVSGE